MRVVGLPRSFYYVSQNRPIELSLGAHQRLQLLQLWERLRGEGYSGVRAAELVGVPRATLYRWKQRLEREGLRGLEERSRRPKRYRRRHWNVALVKRVRELRERFPRWGKDKLVVLLKAEGWQVSASTVGRILGDLKRRGALVEAPRGGVKKQRRRRPYAERKPKGYEVKEPGDLVQVDTLELRPLPGVKFYQFTARDVVSRWDVVMAAGRLTARDGKRFLEQVLARMPFRVKAIQVDGGSEFMGVFEAACREKGVRLFVLPPRSPKLNGHVERAQRTHLEEFYEVYLGDLDLGSVNQALRRWEQIYNTVRPHQSLDGKTPAEYLRKHHPQVAPNLPSVSYVLNEYRGLHPQAECRKVMTEQESPPPLDPPAACTTATSGGATIGLARRSQGGGS